MDEWEPEIEPTNEPDEWGEDPTEDPAEDPKLATLTPYPIPDPTMAPTPLPSSKIPLDSINALTRSDELVGTPTPSPEAAEYDGPAKTGKTLKDLAMELGAPSSLGTLIDEMQDAIVGIIGDLVNNNGERTSVADIFGHGNRLRGLGALFVLVALVGLAIDSTVGSSLKPLETVAKAVAS